MQSFGGHEADDYKTVPITSNPSTKWNSVNIAIRLISEHTICPHAGSKVVSVNRDAVFSMSLTLNQCVLSHVV